MYKFQLESVLKYRKNIERHHAQDMAVLTSRLKDAELELSRLIGSVKKMSVTLAGEEKKGIGPQKAVLYRSSIDDYRTKVSRQEDSISDIHRLIHKKRHELSAAASEKKAVEKLKEKDKKIFLEKMKKKDQKFMDDIAAKKHYSRRG